MMNEINWYLFFAFWVLGTGAMIKDFSDIYKWPALKSRLILIFLCWCSPYSVLTLPPYAFKIKKNIRILRRCLYLLWFSHCDFSALM